MKRFFLILLTAVCCTAAWAQIPLTVQGSLKDSGGNALNGSYDMQFGIYNVASSGSALWTETHTGGSSVVVTNGIYSAQLGSITPFPPSLFTGNLGTLYLEVTVGTDSPMTPRQKLQATAVANAVADGAVMTTSLADGSVTSAKLDPALKDSLEHTGAIYRWAAFSTYSQAGGWFANNNASLFGGVLPGSWTDGAATAQNMSADKDVLRTLFCQKGYGGKNAVVYADEWYPYSTTNGKVALALFRIKNTTASAISWSVTSHHTGYGSYGEFASIALNGTNVWSSGNPMTATFSVNNVLSIPANRTSTAIFVSTSGPPSSTRSCFLAFSNNCLALPAGLEFVDDLDTAAGGWEQ